MAPKYKTPLTCEICLKPSSVRTGRRYCSQACTGESKRRLGPYPLCEWCGKAPVKRARSLFCGAVCRVNAATVQAQLRGPEMSLRVQEWHRLNPNIALEASERMRARNPMHSETTRKKVSITLRALGHRPPVQGGNGRGLTVPQQILRERLGSAWVTEFVIPTHQPRNNPARLPGHYKIDLAQPNHLLAVELDGTSHGSMLGQERDRKKDNWLHSCGWTVFRFPNKRILTDLESVCAQIQGKLQSSTSP